MKTLLVFCLLSLMLFTSCASDKVIEVNGQRVEAPAYGLVNRSSKEVPGIRYEISFGSVAVCFLFSPSVLIPLYVIGWDLYEAVGVQQPIIVNPPLSK